MGKMITNGLIVTWFIELDRDTGINLQCLSLFCSPWEPLNVYMSSNQLFLYDDPLKINVSSANRLRLQATVLAGCSVCLI